MYPILAPRDTWYTQGGTSIKRSTITEIHIRDSYTPTGPVTAQWDGSAAKDGSITIYIEGTVLTIAGNGSGKVQANADSMGVFASNPKDKDYYTSLKIFDPESFYTGEAEDFYTAFQYSALESIDWMADMDFGKCRNIGFMFYRCSGLGDVDLPNLAFPALEECTSLLEYSSVKSINISGWKMPAAIKTGYMFGFCPNLKTVNMQYVQMPVAQTFSHMFADDFALTTVNMQGLVAPQVLNYGAMYNDCTALEIADVSMLTAEAHAYSQFFERCKNLKKIIGLPELRTGMADHYVTKTDSQTAFSEFMAGCEFLEDIDLRNLDTRKARTNYTNCLSNMFTGMLRLKKVTLGPNFDWTGGKPEDPPVGTDIPVLPTPDPTYIPGADGHWYDKTGKAYTPEEAIKTVPNVYYASKAVLYGSELAVMDRAQMREIAEYVRQATGLTGLMQIPGVMKAVVDFIGKKLDATALPSAIDTALAQAKASGAFDGKDGATGPQGEPGRDGKDGAPGLPGVPGKDGAPGKQGPVGPQGEPGKDGAPGKDGQNGAPGAKGDTGPQGLQGKTGERGPEGKQGPAGKDGAPGKTGPAGKTPVKGVDYWTASDKQGIVDDVLAALPKARGVDF